MHTERIDMDTAGFDWARDEVAGKTSLLSHLSIFFVVFDPKLISSTIIAKSLNLRLVVSKSNL